ncbi:MAG TPA: ATP-binding protein [Candidatus Paceibacterota bacterium]
MNLLEKAQKFLRWKEVPKRGTEEREAVQALFAELSKLSEHSHKTKTLQERFAKLEGSPGSLHAYELVELYLEFEGLLSDPKNQNKQVRVGELRKTLANIISIGFLPPPLALLFTETEVSQILLYEVGLERIVSYVHSTLGADRAVRIISRYNERHVIDGVRIIDGSLRFSDFNNRVHLLKTPLSELETIFSGLFSELWNDLTKALGEKITRNIILRLVTLFKNTYGSKAASIFLRIIPDDILEDEHLSYLNREELEQKIKKRTTELKSENEEIEQRIINRTHELAIEKKKLDIITERMTSGVVLLDQGKHVLFANRAARAIIKVSPDVTDGGAVLAQFLALFKDINLDEYFKQCYPDGSFLLPEIIANDCMYRISLNCLHDNEQHFSGMLIWIEDVTEQKILEKKKADFVSLVTHQLRTPLSGLKWTLRMLINGDLGSLSNEQKVFLMKSYESNERMISLVDNILGINRVESDVYEYHYMSTQIVDLIDNVLFEVSPVANKKRINIQFIKDLKLPKAMIDSEKMRAVLQNLLENAVKYTLDGGSIKIETLFKDNFIRVSISDSGIGIPKAQQGSVFSQFFRAQNAATVKAEGSGLGLYIVKGIVEKHHGKIWFDSVEGKGTTFYFTVPAVQSGEQK